MATDISGMVGAGPAGVENRAERVREERTTAEVAAGGSVAEAICGAGVVVLAIVGLAGVFPTWMAAVSAIALGSALLLRGTALTARYYSLLDETGSTSTDAAELGSGIGAEILGGAAGVVLGILALLDISPLILLPVAAIVFGGTLLLGCGSNARLNDLIVCRPQFARHDTGRRVAGDILAAANGAQALVGLGTIVLGIIGLANPNMLTLTLVAFLGAGASVLLSGSTVTGKMMTMLWKSPHHGRFGHAV